MSLFKKINNADAAVQILLKELGVSVDADKISEELVKHPEYPNLLSISDVLANFGIANDAYEVPADDLPDVPCPFVAHAHTNAGDYLVVHQMDSAQVVVSNNKWRRHKLSLTEFKEVYNGTVLAVENTGAIASVKTTSTLPSLRVPLIVTGFLLVLVTSVILYSPWFTRLNWSLGLLALIKTAGLATAILLLVQSIDRDNPLVQALCQNKGKTNCNAILASKAANVFEGLSWSEVGFFYFGGTWLALLFCSGQPAALNLLAILNLISLPYTFYSAYYQAQVAKQWCVLCCTVQALLWLEFAVLVTSFPKPFNFLANGIAEGLAPVAICFLLPILSWLTIKPMLQQMWQVAPLKDQLRKFKYDSKLFNTILTAQPQYATPAEDWSIVLGNADASNVITMVTNPYCPPCSSTHKQLEEWLTQNPGLQARIVFTANNDDNDFRTPVSRHLMALNALDDKGVVRQALHDWYAQKQKNYAEWAKVYPIKLNGAEYHKIDAQKAWCQIAEINATPTLLLNGYELPRMYQLPDLKYMLQ